MNKEHNQQKFTATATHPKQKERQHCHALNAFASELAAETTEKANNRSEKWLFDLVTFEIPHSYGMLRKIDPHSSRLEGVFSRCTFEGFVEVLSVRAQNLQPSKVGISFTVKNARHLLKGIDDALVVTAIDAKSEAEAQVYPIIKHAPTGLVTLGKVKPTDRSFELLLHAFKTSEPHWLVGKPTERGWRRFWHQITEMKLQQFPLRSVPVERHEIATKEPETREYAYRYCDKDEAEYRRSIDSMRREQYTLMRYPFASNSSFSDIVDADRTAAAYGKIADGMEELLEVGRRWSPLPSRPETITTISAQEWEDSNLKPIYEAIKKKQNDEEINDGAVFGSILEVKRVDPEECNDYECIGLIRELIEAAEKMWSFPATEAGR